MGLSAGGRSLNAAILEPLVDAFAASKAGKSLFPHLEDPYHLNGEDFHRFDAYGNDRWSFNDRWSVNDHQVTTLSEKMTFLAGKYGDDERFQELQRKYDLFVSPNSPLARRSPF